MEWRRDPAAVATAVAWLSRPEAKVILAILHHETPSRSGVLPLGASEIDCARALGAQQGYEKALMDLVALGEPMRLNEEPEPTFKDEFNEEGE